MLSLRWLVFSSRLLQSTTLTALQKCEVSGLSCSPVCICRQRFLSNCDHLNAYDRLLHKCVYWGLQYQHRWWCHLYKKWMGWVWNSIQVTQLQHLDSTSCLISSNRCWVCHWKWNVWWSLKYQGWFSPCLALGNPWGVSSDLLVFVYSNEAKWLSFYLPFQYKPVDWTFSLMEETLAIWSCSAFMLFVMNMKCLHFVMTLIRLWPHSLSYYLQSIDVEISLQCHGCILLPAGPEKCHARSKAMRSPLTSCEVYFMCL